VVVEFATGVALAIDGHRLAQWMADNLTYCIARIDHRRFV
jgi:hypothetical protein